MNNRRLIFSAFLLLAISIPSISAEQNAKLGENAALRYWAAFAQMQDTVITDQQAAELNSVLDGTSPYNDTKYRELIEKNKPALETLARASALPNCDWGIDYQLGTEAPVDYVRKAIALGRLNVLLAFHLLIVGDKEGAVHTLTVGLRFSHDLANGGTLFATVVAKTLLVQHLGAMEFALHVAGLSAAQRSVLSKAVAQLGPDGLDWQSAVKREFEVLRGVDSKTSTALTQIAPNYLSVLTDSSVLPKLQEMIASAPPPLPGIIPNPKHVLDAKRSLTEKIRQALSRLQ
ncbi:MAG: hypothetical protein U0V70_13545 [Terriglobia bacterium]